MIATGVQLNTRHRRRDRNSHELGMGMGEWRSGFDAMVLENLQIAEARVLSQIEEPRTVGLKDIGCFAEIHLHNTALVVSRLDNNFMGTDAMHGAVEAHGLRVQIPFDSQGRELVRYDPDLPTWPVGRCFARSLGVHLRRGFVLLPWTKGTDCQCHLLALDKKLARLPRALMFSNDPGSFQRIPSEFRQGNSPY
jgi:hypothetical protein